MKLFETGLRQGISAIAITLAAGCGSGNNSSNAINSPTSGTRPVFEGYTLACKINPAEANYGQKATLEVKVEQTAWMAWVIKNPYKLSIKKSDGEILLEKIIQGRDTTPISIDLPSNYPDGTSIRMLAEVTALDKDGNPLPEKKNSSAAFKIIYKPVEVSLSIDSVVEILKPTHIKYHVKNNIDSSEIIFNPGNGKTIKFDNRTSIDYAFQEVGKFDACISTTGEPKFLQSKEKCVPVNVVPFYSGENAGSGTGSTNVTVPIVAAVYGIGSGTGSTNIAIPIVAKDISAVASVGGNIVIENPGGVRFTHFSSMILDHRCIVKYSATPDTEISRQLAYSCIGLKDIVTTLNNDYAMLKLYFDLDSGSRSNLILKDTRMYNSSSKLIPDSNLPNIISGGQIWNIPK